MNNTYDAIIIGAGVIGSAINFELSKKGWKTLNIDKNPESGYGSTSASCAIIRVHYSTFDGCAMAYEGYHYWKNWNDYLELSADHDFAKFVESGCMIYRTEENGYLDTIINRAKELNIPFELWGPNDIKSNLPIVDVHKYAPVKAPSDSQFGTHENQLLKGAIFFPTAGYVNDPKLSAYNLQIASEEKGGKFLFNKEVVSIIKKDKRAAGVELSDGSKIHSKVVINVAGPHSMKINQMAEVEKEMNIKTKALKVEVSHVSSPANFDYEADGMQCCPAPRREGGGEKQANDERAGGRTGPAGRSRQAGGQAGSKQTGRAKGRKKRATRDEATGTTAATPTRRTSSFPPPSSPGSARQSP